jgi:hypothetical protein
MGEHEREGFYQECRRHAGATSVSTAQPSVPDERSLGKEGNKTDETAEGRDGLRGGSEPDLPSGEDGITRTLHRMVKGRGVRLFDTTLLPNGL